MFSEFRYENFKSYQEAEFPLAPLTLLIGTNASGKSNALEGIRFLSWLSKGQRLDDALRAVQEDDVTIRGRNRFVFAWMLSYEHKSLGTFRSYSSD